MATPQKEGGTFTPEDIAQMARALEIAFQTLSREGGKLVALPESDLRRRLAALIYSEATEGVIDAERLAQIAVRGLRLSSPKMWAT